MSLTSYRAAPPRDKPLLAFPKTDLRNEFGPRPKAPIDPVRRLPEKATRANAHGRERYVPMRRCFGKARERSFRGFIGAEQALSGQSGRQGRSCQNWRKSPALGQQNFGGNAMDQPLKSRGQSALDDAFQRMFELSRTDAGADADRAARPAGAVARGDLGQRKPLRTGDLGGFRPSQQHRDCDRRKLAGARRNQARHQASEEMDGAAAGLDRAAVHAGQEPADRRSRSAWSASSRPGIIRCS